MHRIKRLTLVVAVVAVGVAGGVALATVIGNVVSKGSKSVNATDAARAAKKPKQRSRNRRRVAVRAASVGRVRPVAAAPAPASAAPDETPVISSGDGVSLAPSAPVHHNANVTVRSGGAPSPSS